MQKSSSAEKKRIFWDGEEVPGLIDVQEMKLTKATIKVPGFKRLRTISSNIIEIPVLELKYKVEKGTSTMKFFETFFFTEQCKDCTEVRVDQYDNEIQRRLWPQCECIDKVDSPYRAENPELMVVTIQVAPWDIISL